MWRRGLAGRIRREVGGGGILLGFDGGLVG
jgi:hypothetical protein